jgi:plastocyanin
MTTTTARRSTLIVRLARLSAAGIILAALLAGSAGAAVAEDRWITMHDFTFKPSTVEIRVGDQVTWVNDDDIEHNATNGSFDTGLLSLGESASITFTAPGTYDFFCSPHPSMTGTVIVRSTAAPPTDTLAPASGAAEGPDVRLGALLGLLGLSVLATTGLLARRDRSRAEPPGA